MPLIHSKSPGAFKTNVRNLMGEVGESPHVQSRKQAVAIAFETQRRAKHKQGGGGAYAGIYGPGGVQPYDPGARPTPDDEFFTVIPGLKAAGSLAGAQQRFVSNMHLPLGTVKAEEKHDGGSSFPFAREEQGEAGGSAFRNAAHLARQGGGSLPLTKAPGTPIATAFAGPIHSSMPGRTDRLHLNVRPGSYVFPADAVSIMGQGNTAAGIADVKTMFAPIDLKGGIRMPGGHGMGVPPPSRLAQMGKITHPHFHRAHGGETPQQSEDLVPIVAAGGEIVIPPELIARKFGDLDHGHDIMDEYIKLLRKKEIERLKTAPPPKT